MFDFHNFSAAYSSTCWRLAIKRFTLVIVLTHAIFIAETSCAQVWNARRGKTERDREIERSDRGRENKSGTEREREREK